MSLHLPSDMVVPPGAFYYVVPETGQRVPQAGVTSLYGCIEAVKSHYRANNLVIPSGLKASIEQFNCAKAPPGFCLDGDGHVQAPTELPDVRGTAIEQVLQGTKTIATWITEGTVSEEHAAQRAAVCVTCPHHGDTPCPKCKAGLLERLKTMVTVALRRDPLPWERDLKSCGICGCALKLKIWCLHSAIVKNTRAKQLAAFPPHCWVQTEKQAP